MTSQIYCKMSSTSTSTSTSTCLETLYLESLSPLERSVCAIAESHLQSSFDLSRSSGFIAWKAKRGDGGGGGGGAI